ncbi:MAG: DoxX family protein [Cyanobium sp.]
MTTTLPTPVSSADRVTTFADFAARADYSLLEQLQPDPRAQAPGLAMPSVRRQGLAPTLLRPLRSYLLGQGLAASVGLLALRLAVSVMMIHHGQDKLADPAGFAANYVVPLHLPFPMLMAKAAGYAEVLGSWLLIVGVLVPLGALALIGTMALAAHHHILTSGLNIYVPELVVLYLGGSVALLLLGPGRFSFDAGIVAGLDANGDTAVEDQPKVRPFQPQLLAGTSSKPM